MSEGNVDTTIELGGTEYTLAPLRVSDLMQAHEHLRNTIVRRATKTIPAKASEAMANAIIGAAVVESTNVGFMEQKARLWLSSSEGMCYMLWRSIRSRGSKVTYDELFEQFVSDRVGRHLATLAVLSQYPEAYRPDPKEAESKLDGEGDTSEDTESDDPQ